jgi:O-antigen ligase
MRLEALATTPAAVGRRTATDASDAVNWSTSRWFRASRSILLFMLLAAPLAFGAVQPWASAAIVGLAVLALFCWALGCVRIHNIVLAQTRLYVPALLFLSLAFVQLLSRRTLDPTATRDALILGCAYFILFTLAATLFSNVKECWSQLGKIVTGYTLFLSLFAILQFFTGPDKIYWTVVPRWGGYIFGPYVNHNHYAGLMEMLVALTATVWLGRRRRDAWNWLAGFATLIGLSSVALSGSRAGVGSVLIEMLLLGGIAMLAQRRHNLGSPVPALALGLLCATLVAAWMLPEETTERFRPTVDPHDASFTDRVSMAGDSLRIFRTHMLTGVGLGAFETAYPAQQTFPSDKRVDHAHNDYAEAIAETGLPGALLIAASLVFFLQQGFKNLRYALEPAKDTIAWLRLGATIGCLGLLVHSYFDFNLHIPANAAWFVVCAGLASASVEMNGSLQVDSGRN